MNNDIRTVADDVLHAAKSKASEAAAFTKETAGKATRQAVDTVEGNPLVALVGGLAIGAIAAGLLPRTMREDKLLGGIGATVRNSATNAASAAKSAGQAQLEVLGVTPSAAKDQARIIAKKIGQAATTASNAAGDTFRQR